MKAPARKHKEYIESLGLETYPGCGPSLLDSIGIEFGEDIEEEVEEEMRHGSKGDEETFAGAYIVLKAKGFRKIEDEDNTPA